MVEHRHPQTITRRFTNDEVATQLAGVLASISSDLLPERVLTLYQTTPHAARPRTWILVTVPLTVRES